MTGNEILKECAAKLRAEGIERFALFTFEEEVNAIMQTDLGNELFLINHVSAQRFEILNSK